MSEENTFTSRASAATTPLKRLLAFRRKESVGKVGCSSDVLSQILWLIHASDWLPGFMCIAKNILVLCRYAAKSNDPAIDKAMVARWITELRWILIHSNDLPTALFKTGEVYLREAFLREKRPNPTLGMGASEHGLYRLLWESHPNPDFQRSFRRLQGCALLAHAAIMADCISRKSLLTVRFCKEQNLNGSS